MALTVENANLVWQKANIALDALAVKGVTRDVIRALKAHLAQVKRNPDLAFVPITAAGIAGASGEVLVDAACKLYAVVAKKTATTTDDYLTIFDDASDDTGGATDGRIVLPFLASSEEGIYINPNGLDMAAGVVAKSYTDYDGTTDGSAANLENGFVIVGRP